jgi:hypothetical protein
MMKGIREELAKKAGVDGFLVLDTMEAKRVKVDHGLGISLLHGPPSCLQSHAISHEDSLFNNSNSSRLVAISVPC